MSGRRGSEANPTGTSPLVQELLARIAERVPAEPLAGRPGVRARVRPAHLAGARSRA